MQKSSALNIYRFFEFDRSSRILNGNTLMRLRIILLIQLFLIILRKTGTLFRAFRLINEIGKKYQAIFGGTFLNKAVKVDKRFFWRLGAPGFPSIAATMLQKNEIDRFLSDQDKSGLSTLFIAVTKKCYMRCEHCFEGDNQNKEDKLSTQDIMRIVQEYQNYGTTQIIFSGGEPMLRVDDICDVLSESKRGTDFWIFTSGYDLSSEHAHILKAAGLTGVIVSLDHYEDKKHDQFRGFKGAYELALYAVMNAKNAGLVTALSLCATREFINRENLDTYMDLAKNIGVAFVQFIEPMETGRYSGNDVTLSNENIELLEKVYLGYNNSKSKKKYPIINYQGYYQRRVGCLGSGNRYFYIDADGDAHICPFCPEKLGNALNYSAKEIIDKLSQNGCYIYDRNRCY